MRNYSQKIAFCLIQAGKPFIGFLQISGSLPDFFFELRVMHFKLLLKVVQVQM